MKQTQVLSNKVSSISTVYTIFTLQKLFTWHTWFTLHNFGHKNKKEQGQVTLSEKTFNSETMN